MPMIVTVAGCKGFWIPGQARNDGLGAGMTGWEYEGPMKSEQLRLNQGLFIVRVAWDPSSSPFAVEGGGRDEG